jgi:hypothetical protein
MGVSSSSGRHYAIKNRLTLLGVQLYGFLSLFLVILDEASVGLKLELVVAKGNA